MINILRTIVAIYLGIGLLTAVGFHFLFGSLDSYDYDLQFLISIGLGWPLFLAMAIIIGAAAAGAP